MVDPFAPVLVLLAQDRLVQIDDRQRAEKRFVLLVAHLAHPIAGDISGRLGFEHIGPPDGAGQEETAVLVGDVEVRIGRRDVRDDRRQMRRPIARGPPLDPSEVGCADHANLARGPGLGGGPFDRVVAVLGLVDERFPLSRRRKPPATVLYDVDVAPSREEAPLQLVHLLLVGGAHENDRIRAGLLGSIQIGLQPQAVAHRNRDVRVDHDLVLRLRQEGIDGLGLHQRFVPLAHVCPVL